MGALARLRNDLHDVTHSQLILLRDRGKNVIEVSEVGVSLYLVMKLFYRLSTLNKKKIAARRGYIKVFICRDYFSEKKETKILN